MSIAMTMKKISLMTGFSVSTVSKALNGNKEISEETRDIISLIANQYNYIPNSYARSLRQRKANSVAVILPQVTLRPYNQALYHIQIIAESYGFRVLLFQTFDSKKNKINYVNSLNDGSIGGVFIITTQEDTSCKFGISQFSISEVYIKDGANESDIEKKCHSSFLNFLEH